MSYDVNLRSFEVTIQPKLEPVTADDFKNYARVDDGIDDSYLMTFIKAARIQAESYIGKKFITQTLKTRLDYFPQSDRSSFRLRNAGYDYGYGEQRIGSRSYYWPASNYIALAFDPIQSISSVTTYDQTNTGTVYGSSNYFLDTAGKRLVLNLNSNWPVDLRQRAAIEILTINGYGTTADNVPEDIKMAIKAMAKTLYDCRGGGCDSSGTSTCLGLLEAYKNYDRAGL